MRRRNASYRSTWGSGYSRSDQDGVGRTLSRSSFMDDRAQALAEDKMMGFEDLAPGGPPRIGWLLNMVPSTVEEPSTKKAVQGVDLFFLGDDGEADFRATIIIRPYMYVLVVQDSIREAEQAIRKQFQSQISDVSLVQMEDISAPNHLASQELPYVLKIECNTTADLLVIRRGLSSVVDRNRDNRKRSGAVETHLRSLSHTEKTVVDGLAAVLDVREYDVSPVNRLAIDEQINVGYWYRVLPSGSTENSHARESLEPKENVSNPTAFASASVEKLDDIVERAAPVVLAFDIECTKKPLRFPDADAGDMVMMISWMVDGRGFLVINREVVSADIDNFEYEPKKEIRGSFEVFNEPNEKALLERFFREVRMASPRVFVTYNGDFFDWPFVEKRAKHLGMDMGEEIAMRHVGDDTNAQETKGRTALHMDVFHWVNRDSYLPQGSRGLKAVTRTLLGFEPEEIPPEEMVEAALSRPHDMAKYSVSDAVCTYFLYMKYVHPFTFSLCNILPLSPDDVLRKGSGTLCEMLLMCQARQKKIIAPNKYNPEASGKLTDDGHVLESETYIGGHVEALQSGVFRSDLPLRFSIDPAEIENLEARLDATMRYSITVESKADVGSVTNYEQVKAQILEGLRQLREKPVREEKPLIYHLDVSAMYPNIILTNRLQPHAIVTSSQCAACDFNGVSNCQRDMNWTWRGEYFPATRSEAESVYRRAISEQRALKLKEDGSDLAESTEREGKVFQGTRQLKDVMGINHDDNGPSFDDAGARKNQAFRKRLKDFCKSQYKRATVTREDAKEATVCQRENPFYVDTVRAFRDRRYEYKALLKKQKKELSTLKGTGDAAAIASAEKLVVLYDSLQLAHKCILNSFYGYVMRRGARWFSMEMAGIVTNTGAAIIKRAREFIEKVGVPLELDTDGIWCTLPSSFPCNFTFQTRGGRKFGMHYVGAIFNEDVAKHFTNHQYQDLVNPKTFVYSNRKECSILFEVDGPYRAMVLPASLDEGKSIKKRYAVFNSDGSLAELKGFEIKRRGELKLIKNFQGEVFKKFLDGHSISSCYTNVGAVCNAWLDILSTQGANLDDDSLLNLLVEQNNMSKPLAEYVNAGQKSCAITCARRMASFLGSQIVMSGGLATMYVIAKKPIGLKVTERAIPSMIFNYNPESARRKLLRKWLNATEDADFSLREIIDWEYYRGRLANSILRIVSIPAALQAVDNPVPRIAYPPWLQRKVRDMKDTRKQKKISSFFRTVPNPSPTEQGKPNFSTMQDLARDTRKLMLEDIEDIPLSTYTPAVLATRRVEALVTIRRKFLRTGRRRGKGFVYREFKSMALDPETRRDEARRHMMMLLNQPHPRIRRNYAGWLRYAKVVWKSQRAARVARSEKKRSRLKAGFEIMETVKGPKWLAKRAKTDEFALAGDVDLEEDEESKLDYMPQNFVADLRSPVSFFQQRQTPLLGHGVFWQIVSVAPQSASPGLFRLWVLPVRQTGSSFDIGQLHCIPLHVSRVLYVGSKDAEAPRLEGAFVEEVNEAVKLPRGRSHPHLFRVEVSEDRFQMASNELCSLRDAKMLEAVYGTKVPLSFYVIVALGILCRPRRQIEQKLNSRQLLSQGLDLRDISSKDATGIPYLKESLDQSSPDSAFQAYLYASESNDNSSRGVYLLVSPPSNLCTAFVVKSSGESSVNLRRVWEKLLDDLSIMNANGSEDVQKFSAHQLNNGSTEFTVLTFTSHTNAHRAISQTLSSVRGGGGVTSKDRGVGSRTILLVQWHQQKVALANVGSSESSSKDSLLTAEDCIPSLKLFPVIQLPTNDLDGDYLPIGWESLALSTALSRFVEVASLVSDRISFSRFAGIPVGNVAQDTQMQALDVMFGRELINNNHVLWASSAERPDVGGLENDDNFIHDDDSSLPEHVSPGCYRSLCVDVQLSDFSMATMLASSHISQTDKTDFLPNRGGWDSTREESKKPVDAANGSNEKDVGVDSKLFAPLDVMACCAPAFHVLRDLVGVWKNVCNPDSIHVSLDFLSHVYRWVRSDSSVLFDPVFSRFFSWLTKKHFRLLVEEFRMLGVTVVYASLTRLVLATPKLRTIDGLKYTSFLEKTIRSKSLFGDIQFNSLNGVYSGMLFVNPYNYGILPTVEEPFVLSGKLSLENRAAIIQQESTNVPSVHMAWDMARHLPVPIAALWTQVIEEFIRRPVVRRLESIEFVRNSAAESDELLSFENGIHAVKSDGYVVEAQNLIRKVTPLLLEKVQEIREKTERLEFPVLPSSLGRDGHRRKPALEFVRMLCFVFALDELCAENVSALRRSLLQLLGVREFAKEGRFIDPALSLPLEDVVCKNCHGVTNVDVGRGSQGTRGELEPTADGAEGSWFCEHCGSAFNSDQIEMGLVRKLQKTYSSYQVQDLVCTHCRLVKRDNMSSHCACNGAFFELAMPASALLELLHSYRRLAKFHDFPYLLETVNWMASAITL